MCSHYEGPSSKQLLDAFGVEPEGPTQTDFWPGYMGPMIRMTIGADPHDEAVTEFEALGAMFGLLPFWTKDTKLSRSTYNARSETVATKPSFRSAWKEARHCIIPAAAIYEPDWRSGKAVPSRISRADGSIMCIAGLWERWKSPQGETVHSMTMLTVNADEHLLMRNYHRPGDEKRMVVILPNGSIRNWLQAPASESMDFMRQYPADRLIAEPRPSR